MAIGETERQARPRAGATRRIATDALGDWTRAAVDDAVAAVWDFFNRPTAAGSRWDDVADCRTEGEYRAMLAAEPGALVRICRMLSNHSSGLTADERAAVRTIVDIADALSRLGECREFKADFASLPARKRRDMAVIADIADALSLASGRRRR